MSIEEIKRWLATLEPGSTIAIDEDGIALIELNTDGRTTGAYLEVGGPPWLEEEETE